MLKLVECPRDAMQGIVPFIPTAEKVRYINQLLKVGFDTIDFGSFVSEKAITQMRDTEEVLSQLDISAARSKLLAIVANERGAQTAAKYGEIACIGFPFSVSETFQRRNTNSSIGESLNRVHDVQEICLRTGKQLVIYISMGFGNPYNEEWSPEIVTYWCKKLHDEVGIEVLALSDTIGVSTPAIITQLFESLIPELPEVEFGAHLHTAPLMWKEKVTAADEAGCQRFDGALMGMGGCPMAKDKLTGNMPTENLISYFEEKEIATGIMKNELAEALIIASEISALRR
ncbi:MAG: hydroxymethylglutaryl-CoA lyase [Crocinitomicaceae bacterium]|nr:hydroxymethylglutaryl-CoA lyase [Crocinitomicaceae bacterium]